ncbi:MAG TPA: M56 family metallopeptidase [Xanthomonadales bacterium]|nr:M56 family metallopeptidase [Xanthomonadales bacterium]
MNAAWIDWVQALGWSLLHFIWQGALVGAVYGALRWLVGDRANWRYAIGLGSLAVLAALPVGTMLRLAPVASDAQGVVAVALGSVSAVADATSGAAGVERWLPLLVGAWLVGVFLSSLRALRQYWRTKELCRRDAQPLPEWEARLRELTVRFGVSRPVKLVKSAIVQTPSLIGWLAPVIVLPASVLVGLTPKQLELVIAHELGHIRRWDYLVNLMQVAVETVLFYHPVVHWISREVRNDREACCDDLVLRLGADPVDYATTLASLEELRDMTHAPALAASGGFLLGRIRRIVGAEQAAFAAPVSGGQGLLLVALAFTAFLAMRPVTHDALRLIGVAPASDPPANSQSTDSLLARSAALAIQELATKRLPVVAAPAAPATPAPAAIVAADEVPQVAAPAPVLRPQFRLPDAAPAALDANASPADFAARPGLALAVLPAPTREPIAITRVSPVFPRDAMLAGKEGAVTLGFIIDGSGRARDVKVVEASEPDTFDAAAIAALRDWRFAQASRGGNVRYTLTFDFALAKDAEGEEQCKYSVGSRICRRYGGEGFSSTMTIDADDAQLTRLAPRASDR